MSEVVVEFILSVSGYTKCAVLVIIHFDFFHYWYHLFNYDVGHGRICRGNHSICRSQSCLSWFESYLCHRKQRVSLNNNLSSTSEVIHGVPQGSILGPLLFLIFINDLHLYLQNNTSTIDLYADDTTIYYSCSNILMLERNLQKSLDCLQIWCRENGMILNTDKTKVMLITSRQKRNESPVQ